MFFVWLKRYVPRGIYGRAALILLLPVVILQLVVVVIFAQRHFEGVTTQMTDTVQRELALVLRSVKEAPDREAVPAFVRERLGLLAIAATPVSQAQVPTQNNYVWYDYSGRVLARRMAERLPEYAAVDLSRGGVVDLFVNSEKGPLVLRFDRRRISAANPHQMFVYTVFFGLVLSLIASIYLRNQLRPIKRLARAAEAFGRGRHESYSPSARWKSEPLAMPLSTCAPGLSGRWSNAR